VAGNGNHRILRLDFGLAYQLPEGFGYPDGVNNGALHNQFGRERKRFEQLKLKAGTGLSQLHRLDIAGANVKSYYALFAKHQLNEYQKKINLSSIFFIKNNKF
jgi:hypothetical protein